MHEALQQRREEQYYFHEELEMYEHLCMLAITGLGTYLVLLLKIGVGEFNVKFRIVTQTRCCARATCYRLAEYLPLGGDHGSSCHSTVPTPHTEQCPLSARLFLSRLLIRKYLGSLHDLVYVLATRMPHNCTCVQRIGPIFGF